MVEKLLKPRSQILIIGGISAAIVLYNLLFEWPASIQVPLKQQAFLVAVEEGDNAAWDHLLSESYRDQWEFSKSNALVALQDVRSQLIGIKIDWNADATFVDEGEGTLRGSMKVEATGFFGTDFITSRINRLDAPWVFHWRKESWRPWSWKLVRIENEDLSLGGYEPGELTRKAAR